MLCIAAALLVLAGSNWWRTKDAVYFRARFTGYDGCLCDDCIIGLGLGPLPPRGGCVAPAPNPGGMAAVQFIAATALTAGCFVIPRVRTAPDRERCGACGYDLAGLPRPICPECGRCTVRPMD